MSVVINKTQKPLSVPLPGGKTLHLGPGKTGQIATKSADDLKLKKLVEAGEIEILTDDDPRSNSGPRGGQKGRNTSHGYAAGGGARHGGDR